MQSVSDALPHLSPPNTNPHDLISHGRGESFHPPSPPAAILTPQSTTDVASILKLCTEHNVPVVPYGKGTSVEGHVCAIDERASVSLDLEGFKDIEIDDGLTDGYVRVGAGVTRLELNEALR